MYGEHCLKVPRVDRYIFRNIASLSIILTQQETHLIIGDYVFSGIFIAELLAKWLALSIPTYFKDKWNWWAMLQ